MLKLNIGDRELKVKFGYEPTLKNRIISKVAKYENAIGGGENLEAVEDMLLFLPEFLLTGLQVYHKDDYKFNWTTGEGKDEQLSKMFELIEQYCNSEKEDEDAISLYQKLTQEMLNDGFLKSMFRKEMEKAGQKSTKVTKIPKKEN